MTDGPVAMLVPSPLPPDLSRAEFIARCRELGAFSTSLPLARHMRRYAQYDPVDLYESGLRGTPAEPMVPDDLGILSSREFESAQAWKAFLDDPEYPLLAAEHQRVLGDTGEDRFARGNYAVGRKVERVKGDEPARLKLFGFLRRRERLSREQFLEEWHRFSSERYMTDEAIAREHVAYTQYHGLADEFSAQGFDGVLEASFRDPAGLLAWLEATVNAGLTVHQDFWDEGRSLFLVVTENVLYDASGSAALAGGEHAAANARY